MPNIIEIADTSLPQLDVFARLTEGKLPRIRILERAS